MKLEIRGVEKLSFRERQVVTLKELGRRSDEIARQLGLSVATVATLLARARQKGYQVVLVIEGDPLAILGEDDADLDGEPDQEGQS